MYRYAYLIAIVLIVGLVLRFGKSSTELLKQSATGVNKLAGTLSLQGFKGNTP